MIGMSNHTMCLKLETANSLKTEIHAHVKQNISSYLTENTLHVH
jgi:hypothetical protein